MSTDRAAGTTEELSEGRRVRARYRGGEVTGRVLEVRRETAEVTRVVLEVDGDVELDTDAARVEPVGRVCRRCGVDLARDQAYRCPECGADLVRE
jgi:predicted Zn-ribbon and HTH transcriptional regulator